MSNTPKESLPAPVEERGIDEQEHPISDIVRSYLTALRDISRAATVVVPHAGKWQLDEIKKEQKKIDRHLPPGIKEGDKIDITLENIRDFVEFTSATQRVRELSRNKIVPTLMRSLFMQIFCEFDTLTGDLLKCVYQRNQAILKSIARDISFVELLEFGSIEEAKLAIFEKEIENFRRDSYSDQFANLEKKFGLTLKKFPEWGEFMELSQRRNIFVHNDGVVSAQYLNICDREQWQFKVRPKIGDRLDVDPKYFMRAVRVISKVGYMLSHTLWMKLFPDECKQVHRSIQDSLYSLLEDKRWALASELTDFVLGEPMRRGTEELDLRIRAINCAIAWKFSGNDEASKKILRSFDWTASYRDFKLAILVLEDKFEDAAKLMKEIGKRGEIVDQAAYHKWPLFHKFREESLFHQAYQEIYAESFSRITQSDIAIASGETDAVSSDKSVSDAEVKSKVKRRVKK